MKLYENIKQRRLQLGYSQAELAEKLGYTHKSMISKIERGKVDLTESKVMAFAEALDTTAAHLMGWDTDEFDEMIEQYHASVDYLAQELSVADKLQIVLQEDPALTNYEFSEDQLLDILRYARFIAKED